MRRIITLVCLCFGYTLLAEATPAIAVSPQILYLGANQRAVSTTVGNLGNEKVSVKVTPYRIENPGTKKEKKVEIKDPHEQGIFVSPQTLVIPPKGERKIRFVRLGAPKVQEQAFVASVVPQVGKLKAKDTNAIKLVIAYGVRVFVLPTHIREAVVLSRDGKQANVTNKGNVSAVLFDGKQCQGKKCTKLPSFRLYPGQTHTVALKASSPVSYEVSYPHAKVAKLTSH
ncbi:MAG: hypothetical protein COV52_07515 [Gammaproteobacteria bacterium CG11_big_fil_rev_8_21_14_0_20_46_22]|nr:MAG: hypothetical protein COW05_06755 [Gammaproteobacteria bacterium CG12_big_fil_rev_8_21_14_0_65_46_12]PIR10730.1 MAG: hypothetical protein COV52_07515 [Gammaproteobacteria bacterium CG11_big_fil_rev_8_21_14_0_20_46_22]